jgi:hypothetical protein
MTSDLDFNRPLRADYFWERHWRAVDRPFYSYCLLYTCW